MKRIVINITRSTDVKFIYYKITIDILCEFDKVVPCEPYLGLEPFEASLLMNEIRKSNCAHEAIQHLEMFKSGDV